MKLFVLTTALIVSASVSMAQETTKTPRSREVKQMPISRPTQSTGTQEQSSEPVNAEVQTPVLFKGVTGVVHVSTECGTYIEVVIKNKPFKYYPLNLPAEFDKDGTNISFDYIEEASKYPENCDYSKAITMNNVQLVRTTR